MKRIFLSFILLVSLQTFAQMDMDYIGPAKVTVKAFWDGAAKLEQSIAAGGSNLDRDKLLNLGKKIQDTKIKDAGYNTTDMEVKFKKLAEGIVSLKNNVDNAKQQAIELSSVRDISEKKVNDLLTFLFDGNIDDHTPAEKKVKADELIQLDKSANKTSISVWLTRLNRKALEAQNLFPKLEKICKEETREIEAKKRFRDILAYQAYWEAAQKVFPQEEEFGKTFSLITKIVNGLGSEENLLELTKKNNEQKIKDTRLPVAKVKDATQEKLFMDAYNSMYSESFKGKAIKAIVLSDDWKIQRNEVTGIVTGRLRKGAIVYKNSDGQCHLIEEFYIQQEYVGNSFIGTKSVYAVGKGQEILCENVK